jgi:ABC-2 type transport system permease protein
MTLAEADIDAETMSILSIATDIPSLVMMFVWLLLFLLGGFLFYSAMFAAVGSAVDSIQDANQLQTPITVPIILALILAMSVFNDPNSSLAFWGSIIPFTSPVVMMARIPFDIPQWQIILSLVLLYISVAGMAWVAGKIYRVGIFMHGKKPSFKELLSWIKQ